MRIRGIAAVVLAVALVAASALPAYAAPQWGVVPTPSPLAEPSGSLSAIACPTAALCFSVGGDGPMAQRANGSTWTLIALPKPVTSTLTRLEGIACPSTTSCFAVGYWQPSQSGPQKTLIDHWNGTAWSIQNSPNPTGATNFLSAVACPSTASCFAIGSNQNGSVQTPMIMHWNGTAWSVQMSVNPAGSSFKNLRGVACSGLTNCFAVGSIDAGSSATPLAEHWNGTGWSASTLVNPAGATRTRFYGVTCPAALSCFAVGSAVGGSSQKTVVEHWTGGTTWSLMVSGNASGVPSSALLAVTCQSAALCFAVGESNPAVGVQGIGNTLIERLTGTSWTVVASPNPVNRGNSLTAVGCPAVAHCFAAGSVNPQDQSFVEEWKGSSPWVIDAPPIGSSQSQFTGITCATASASSCFAVGFNSTTSGYKSLIEHWNGSSWAIMQTPNPAGENPSDIRFAGVGCDVPVNCFAVGTYYNASAQATALIEHWTGGSTWTVVAPARPIIVPGAHPTYSAQTYFNGISCPSQSNCYAVGAYEGLNGAIKSLVEHWDGTGWKVQTSANGAGGETILAGVSCATNSSCFAIGTVTPNTTHALPYILTLSGTSWGLSPSANPAGSSQTELTSVSCSAASSCFALGSYVHLSKRIPLAEQWKSGSWKALVAPAMPALPAGATLDSVSCPKLLTVCWAVGTSTPATGERPLAAKWNGSAWAAVATPVGPGWSASWLSAVTCSSATACVAGGSYVSSSNLHTLIERYR